MRNTPMNSCINKIEAVLEHKLRDAAENFKERRLQAIDIGVFPWHSKIEISFLFEEDNEDLDDIAAWPNYDYSGMNEGKWPEGIELANSLAAMFDRTGNAIEIFQDFGKAVKSEKIKKVLGKFSVTSDFVVQVLNPDDNNSENFCA